MRTLCPKHGKGGGKIHPSPAEDPIRAAFRLLPAAILVLVAGLGPEDLEVLAYFVTMPVPAGLPKVPTPSEQPARVSGGRGGCRRVAIALWGGHPPTHACGCFDCYISFWSRWDGSPERDRIVDAISAFEAHLAAAAEAAPAATTPPSSSKRRDRGKRSRAPPPLPLPMPLRRPMSPREFKVVTVVQELSSSPLPLSCPAAAPAPVPAPAAYAVEEEKAPESPAEAEAEEFREVAVVAEEEQRKRGWADVLGRRLWGIWSPAAVESAT